MKGIGNTDIGICIPSSNRADRVHTLKTIPDDWKQSTFVVIPERQYKDYKKHVPPHMLLTVPEDWPDGIGSHRHYTMKYSPFRYVWMMDDDVTYSRRHKDTGVKLHKCSLKDMWDLLIAFHTTFVEEKDIPMVGVSSRFGNNYIEADYEDNGRTIRSFCISQEAYKKNGICFSPFEPFVMEDFHVILCFLEKGLRVRVFYNFAVNDVGGSNAPGGCSTWRGPEVHERVAKWMQKTHPSVKAVLKSSKTAWKGFPTDKNGNALRWDVIIQWKKAYKKPRPSKGISNFI